MTMIDKESIESELIYYLGKEHNIVVDDDLISSRKDFNEYIQSINLDHPLDTIDAQQSEIHHFYQEIHDPDRFDRIYNL